MMRILVVVLLVVVACGRPGRIAGAVVAAGGLALAVGETVSCADENPHDCIGSEYVAVAGLGLAVVGLIVVVASGSEEVPVAAPPPRLHTPLAEPATTTDRYARQLALQAHSAAENADCAPARRARREIRTRDPKYYEQTFLGDPAIAACLK